MTYTSKKEIIFNTILDMSNEIDDIELDKDTITVKFHDQIKIVWKKGQIIEYTNPDYINWLEYQYEKGNTFSNEDHEFPELISNEIYTDEAKEEATKIYNYLKKENYDR